MGERRSQAVIVQGKLMRTLRYGHGFGKVCTWTDLSPRNERGDAEHCTIRIHKVQDKSTVTCRCPQRVRSFTLAWSFTMHLDSVGSPFTYHPSPITHHFKPSFSSPCRSLRCWKMHMRQISRLWCSVHRSFLYLPLDRLFSPLDASLLFVTTILISFLRLQRSTCLQSPQPLLTITNPSSGQYSRTPSTMTSSHHIPPICSLIAPIPSLA